MIDPKVLLAISRAVVSSGLIGRVYLLLRRQLNLLPYWEALRRNRISFWLILAGMLGWILSRVPAKRQNAYQLENITKQEHASQQYSPKVGRNQKGRLTIFSMGTELLIAVGLNLLRNHIKSWSSEIFASRKHAHRQETLSSSREKDTLVEGEFSGTTQGKSLLTESTKPKYARDAWSILKTTATQWIGDKCPQLGAALAYFTVFSLAPLVLLLLALFGLFFGSEHARDKITEQLQYLIDPNGIRVIQDIAASASKPRSGILATVLGVVVGLFGASGVFGQLQDALNTIWGVKPKPGAGLWSFLRARFLSFAMVGGVCFLLLVSLTVESVLRGVSTYLQKMLPGGHILALTLFFIFDLAVVIFLFAMIFRYLPDVKIAWRDVWMGASLTAVLFVIGKFILGLYLGSGAAGSAYGAASSLITLLLWIYYSAQILLFGAEFTQVYANTYGSQVEPEEHAVKFRTIEVEIPA